MIWPIISAALVLLVGGMVAVLVTRSRAQAATVIGVTATVAIVAFVAASLAVSAVAEYKAKKAASKR